MKIPGQPSDYSDSMLSSFVTLADVMATGYHAAASAEVKAGDTVVVLGDGAVGLCGVIAAKLRGAKRIIAMMRHEDRQQLAREFGATDIVPERGDAAVTAVMALTAGVGVLATVDHVVEGLRQFEVGAAEVAVQRGVQCVGRSPRRRHRNAKDRVGAQTRLVRRAVQGDYQGVDVALVERILPLEGVIDLVVDVVDGLEDALALQAVAAVAELDGLFFTGGSAGWGLRRGPACRR